MRSENSEYILEVEDLSVEFHTPSGVVHAVSHSSFKLREGETLGIVGESGSGKSVTANAIMRLLPETAKVTGTIRFKGQDIMQMKTKDFNRIRGKEISMIFQDPMTSLNPLYTVGNQLEEVLKLHLGLKGEAATRRAVELLDMVAIPQPETRVKQYPHEFSGGMRQRVMIAMALACNPKILIADEPTTALDVTIQAQILELMKELQKKISTSHHHDHPRSGHRLRSLRPRQRHVRQPDHGERLGRRPVLPHRASLHAGSAALLARGGAEPRGQAPAPDHGLAGRFDDAARRLRLLRALRALHEAVPEPAPGTVRGGSRAYLALLADGA